MNQGTEFCFEDLFLWDGPLLVSELQHRFKPKRGRADHNECEGMTAISAWQATHRFPSVGSLNFAAKMRQTAIESRRLAFVTNPWREMRTLTHTRPSLTFRQSNSKEMKPIATVDTSMPLRVQPTKATFLTFLI
jgi:hypothetical protein